MQQIGIDARLTYYRDGGISTYIRNLISSLEKLQSNESFIVFQSRKDKHTISTQFSRQNLWTPAHHRLERLTLSAELLPHHLDLFHSPDFIPPYRAARRHVITVHDLTFLHYPEYLTRESRQYYNQQISSAVNHADHILAVSEATQQDLIDYLGVPVAKITIQPHGSHPQYRRLPDSVLESAHETYHLPPHFFLHVGTWEPRKNIVGFLRGYQILLESIPDAPPVVLAGRPGWLFEESMREIEAMNLHARLIWRDDISDEQLPILYNLASALVSTSFYEGFGMPALEAMACGTVPIVSNRSSLPEVVGNTGILVDPEDPKDIAQALERVLTDQDWVATQRQLTIERAATFTWERSAQIALQVYKSVS